jgi:hypothetical protein
MLGLAAYAAFDITERLRGIWSPSGEFDSLVVFTTPVWSVPIIAGTVVAIGALGLIARRGLVLNRVGQG